MLTQISVGLKLFAVEVLHSHKSSPAHVPPPRPAPPVSTGSLPQTVPPGPTLVEHVNSITAPRRQAVQPGACVHQVVHPGRFNCFDPADINRCVQLFTKGVYLYMKGTCSIQKPVERSPILHR